MEVVFWFSIPLSDQCEVKCTNIMTQSTDYLFQTFLIYFMASIGPYKESVLSIGFFNIGIMDSTLFIGLVFNFKIFIHNIH